MYCEGDPVNGVDGVDGVDEDRHFMITKNELGTIAISKNRKEGDSTSSEFNLQPPSVYMLKK